MALFTALPNYKGEPDKLWVNLELVTHIDKLYDHRPATPAVEYEAAEFDDDGNKTKSAVAASGARAEQLETYAFHFGVSQGCGDDFAAEYENVACSFAELSRLLAQARDRSRRDGGNGAPG